MRTCKMLGSLGLALMMSCFTSQATAQQQSMRTGDGLLSIATDMPSEATQGDQFKYSIQVRNVSDNVVLHQIKLKQTASKGFTVESVSMDQNNQSGNKSQSGSSGKQNKNQKNASGNNSSDSQQSDNQSKQKQGNKKNKQKKSNNSSSNDSDSKSKKSGSKSDSQSGMSKSNMTIDKLEPGQSETLYVTATAENEGQLRSCLEIVSYRPAICMTAKVVKPELELTKTAPKKANRCDVIELEYALKNGGSGDVGPIQITDELGDGLATIEGKSKLKFDIDGLEAGETRNFIARVFAKKPGDFSSRATAKAEESDLSSRSKKTSTKVIATDLAVQVDGPDRIYGDQLATFTATVTNEGNADAQDVRVQVMWPQSANLVDMGDVSKKKDSGKNSKSKSGNSNNSDQPTVAVNANEGSNNKGGSGNQSKSGNNQSDSNDQSMTQESFTINQLKAGQSAEFTYAVRPSDNEEIPTKVVARYVCSVDAAQDVAKAESTTKAMAMKTAKVVRLPALQLIVVDGQDPVAKDNEVVYTVRVWNEGDAKDQNVKLSVELPDALKFEDAQGPTDFSKDGSTITFEPIDTVEAGTQKDYKLTATVDASSGKDIRVKAKLTSDALQNAVTAEEPTRLFSRQASR